jgi:hypothetical protein
MLTKNDFQSEDWTTLRNTQYLVGLAALTAASSGLGTIKESIALAQGIMGNQASSFPFIRDLTGKSEMEAAQRDLRQLFGEPEVRQAKDGLRSLALEHVRESLSILDDKASAEELEAYRKMLYDTAENVVNAASEGGFLGFGGTRVSSGEQSFLDELRSTLQLELAKKP